MTLNMRFKHGDSVLVFDHKDRYEGRGTIRGRHESREGAIYDVQPDGEPSITQRVCGIPEAQLRPASAFVDRTVRAYERPASEEPKHIRDEI